MVLAAGLTFAPLAATAAPTSMLHTLPQGGEVSQTVEPSRMAWLTKWFKGGPPQPSAAYATPTAAPGSSGMAYQAPPSATPPSTPLPTQAAFNRGWHGFTPNAAAASTPLGAMPTYAAPANQSLAGVTPSMTTPVAKAPKATDCKSLRNEGHAKDRSGDLAAAEHLYRQAIGTDPTSSAAVNDLGLCLARQGKLEPSAAVFRQAIMMRPDKQLYRNNIATVLVELGQTQEALAHLKTAYGPATAHHNVGQLLAKAGKQEEAIDQMQQALAADPTLAPARQALASITPQPPAAIAASPQPTPVPAYQPAQVAAMPSAVVAPTPAPPEVEYAPSGGVPSFPRLLPPVLDR